MTEAANLAAAVDLVVGVIRGTPAERYGDPTPCTDYTVTDVVNHLAFGFLPAHHSATRHRRDDGRVPRPRLGPRPGHRIALRPARRAGRGGPGGHVRHGLDGPRRRWIGAEVPVPDDASAFRRALGVSGRDPEWSP